MRRFQTILLYFFFTVSLLQSYGQKNISAKELQNRYLVLITEALNLEMLNRDAEALASYANIIKSYPKASAAYYGLYTLYKKAEQTSDAEKMLLLAIKFDTANEWYLKESVSFYEELKNSKLLVKSAYKLNSLFPGETNKFVLAKTLYLVGNIKESVKLLKTISQNSEIFEDAYNMLLNIGVETRSSEILVHALTTLALVFHYDIRYHGMLAEYYLNNREYVKAYAIYSDMKHDFSNEIQFKYSITSYYIQTDSIVSAINSLEDLVLTTDKEQELYNIFYNLFYSYKGGIPFNTRIELLYKALLTNPKNAQLVGIGIEVFFKAGKTDMLESVLKAAFYSAKPDMEIFKKYLLFLSEKGDMAALSSASSYALDLFPNYPMFYLFKGMTLIELGNYAEGSSILKLGKELVINDVEMEAQFFIYLGEAAFKLKKYSECFGFFEEALKIDSKNYTVLNNYAYYIYLTDNSELYSKALQMGLDCVTAYPQNVSFLDTYSVILFITGNYSEALKYIGLALKFGGNLNSAIIEHHGDILEKLNRSEDALREWKIALILNENSPSLLGKIKKYEK